MEWSNEVVLEFLELFEQEPVIWNASNTLHKNRNEIHDAWVRIKEKLNGDISVTELKKKKDSLMASFRTCLQKIKQSTRTGAGADRVYKPNWFAFEKMASFLRTKDQPAETINSESIGSQINMVSNESTEDLDAEVNNVINEPTGEDATVGAKFMKNPNRHDVKAPPKKKFKADDTKLHKQIDEAYSIMKASNATKQKDKDECALYCDLLAEKFRKMDERTRDIVMNRIDNFMFEAKMSSSQNMSILQRHRSSPYQYNLYHAQASSPALSANSSQFSQTSHSHSQPQSPYSPTVQQHSQQPEPAFSLVTQAFRNSIEGTPTHQDTHDAAETAAAFLENFQ